MPFLQCVSGFWILKPTFLSIRADATLGEFRLQLKIMIVRRVLRWSWSWIGERILLLALPLSCGSSTCASSLQLRHWHETAGATRPIGLHFCHHYRRLVFCCFHLWAALMMRHITGRPTSSLRAEKTKPKTRRWKKSAQMEMGIIFWKANAGFCSA